MLGLVSADWDILLIVSELSFLSYLFYVPSRYVRGWARLSVERHSWIIYLVVSANLSCTKVKSSEFYPLKRLDVLLALNFFLSKMSFDHMVTKHCKWKYNIYI